MFARFTSTRHSRKKHHIHVPQPDLPQNASVCKYFRCQEGPVRTGTLCHRKHGNRWHRETRRSRPRWACRSRRRIGGCRRSRWFRTTLGDHVARILVCVSCFPCVSRLTVELLIKSGACSCQDADQVASVRKTSAGVWHRARPQQRPGVH